MIQNLELCPNSLVAYLGKPSEEFTKADIVRYIKENEDKLKGPGAVA